MNASAKIKEIRIRPARREDSASLAKLSGQLGYPATTEIISSRLEAAAQDSSSIVLVAELPSGEIAGFSQFVHQRLIEADPRAEVAALVVDESLRGHGVGRLLLADGEQWARERGCNFANLRSNVIRAAAHSFYERLGYSHYKTQKAFRKDLSEPE
jgi:GNAT superfamily N-acetyltransferase